MTELKNCPFCGADGVEVWTPAKSAENYSNTYDIWCGNCDEEFTFDVPDKKTLIRCWNTRPTEDKLKAEIERLKTEISKHAVFLAIHGVEGYEFVPNPTCDDCDLKPPLCDSCIGA